MGADGVQGRATMSGCYVFASGCSESHPANLLADCTAQSPAVLQDLQECITKRTSGRSLACSDQSGASGLLAVWSVKRTGHRSSVVVTGVTGLKFSDEPCSYFVCRRPSIFVLVIAYHQPRICICYHLVAGRNVWCKLAPGTALFP